MVIQLPQEELATSVGIILYSLICLSCSFLMSWLVYVHHEELSYVALVSYFTGLSTAASVAQQIHTLLRWRDIKLDQFQHANANVGNPELAISHESVGIDLALFYIQLYCYNVESALIFFWAFSLAQSIFRLELASSLRKRATYIAKATAVLLPALLVGTLRLEAVQKQTVTFLLLADLFMGFCMSGCGLLLIIILAKYIYTRRNLMSWKVQYGQQSNKSASSNPLVFSGPNWKRRRSIYDNWLVVRFTIAFVAIATYQFFSIIYQTLSSRQNSRDFLREKPDLSVARLHQDLLLFIPGVTASLLDFVVFGTTKTFLDYLVHTLFSRRLLDSNVEEANNPALQRAPSPQALAQRRAAYPPRLSLAPYKLNGGGLGGLYTPISDRGSIQMRELSTGDTKTVEEDDQWPLVSVQTGSTVPKKPVKVYLFPKQ
ncbi:hypothetical protein CGRA01v4_02907 [Colletotrichum graminicola]|uniref:Glycoside hydrolase n=1 Tax=Colletotrichum graminicola (strain M1.001 / M2 / FGSC 10212) TaxID=645133 RepID=E3QA07_COLGM|nr:uncharacterized protein GLRG_02839 [Colletotrichum graminicola M1.001]EFQ27695.1 hypothetical protein GLRG_02839 [Colletotrichum graminicola M1.001]WDK11628.1 hypothetical protein CGRA01v4_02907 [Colletotrichum graminicola]